MRWMDIGWQQSLTQGAHHPTRRPQLIVGQGRHDEHVGSDMGMPMALHDSFRCDATAFEQFSLERLDPVDEVGIGAQSARLDEIDSGQHVDEEVVVVVASPGGEDGERTSVVLRLGQTATEEIGCWVGRRTPK